MKSSKQLLPRSTRWLLSLTLTPRMCGAECDQGRLTGRLLTKKISCRTGVLSDIKSVAEIVKAASPETLVVVDGVCSVGSEEIRFDAWNLDIVITGSQKGLGVPPGLSIVVASQHALEVFKNRKTPVPSYYSNWNKWLPSKDLKIQGMMM